MVMLTVVNPATRIGGAVGFGGRAFVARPVMAVERLPATSAALMATLITGCAEPKSIRFRSIGYEKYGEFTSYTTVTGPAVSATR
jgi:hypothetical protein